MFAVRERYQCGGKEYILLCKDNTPWMVELPHLDEELNRGAEHYPEATDAIEEGWIMMPYEHFQRLEKEGCLEKCVIEEEMGQQSVD